jgi:phosphoketolase
MPPTPVSKRAGGRPGSRSLTSAQAERTSAHAVTVEEVVVAEEEGTTSTPFDMAVMNDLDRFHLVADVIDRVPQLELGPKAAYFQHLA